MTFLATNDVPATELNKPFQRTMNTPGSIPGFLFYPHVGQVWIEGPYDAKGATDTASRRKIFVCRPGERRVRKARARDRIISTLAKHAFRRPPTAADLESLMEFYLAAPERRRHLRRGHRSGAAAHPRRSGIRLPRRSASRRAWPPGKSYRVSDLALASRLSFFLWSSIPDDELIDLAAQGRLKDPAVLEQQVRRMLADPQVRSADHATSPGSG